MLCVACWCQRQDMKGLNQSFTLQVQQEPQSALGQMLHMLTRAVGAARTGSRLAEWRSTDLDEQAYKLLTLGVARNDFGNAEMLSGKVLTLQSDRYLGINQHHTLP